MDTSGEQKASSMMPIHHTEGQHHWALMEVHQELTEMRCLD